MRFEVFKTNFGILLASFGVCRDPSLLLRPPRPRPRFHYPCCRLLSAFCEPQPCSLVPWGLKASFFPLGSPPSTLFWCATSPTGPFPLSHRLCALWNPLWPLLSLATSLGKPQSPHSGPSSAFSGVLQSLRGLPLPYWRPTSLPALSLSSSSLCDLMQPSSLSYFD